MIPHYQKRAASATRQPLFYKDILIVIYLSFKRSIGVECDTGIVPGSGIGNNRAALNEQTLGVPVIALGVPTVVDAGTLAADLLEETGKGAVSSKEFEGFGGNMIVTPKEIDAQVADISKLLGYALNCVLHEGLSIEDVDMLTS